MIGTIKKHISHSVEKSAELGGDNQQVHYVTHLNDKKNLLPEPPRPLINSALESFQMKLENKKWKF